MNGGDTPLVCPRCGNRDEAPQGLLPPCSAGCGATMAVDYQRRLAPPPGVQHHVVAGTTPERAFGLLSRHLSAVHDMQELVQVLNRLSQEELMALAGAAAVVERLIGPARGLAVALLAQKHGIVHAGRRWARIRPGTDEMGAQ